MLVPGRIFRAWHLTPSFDPHILLQMRALVLAVLVAASAAYGPPSNNNPFTRNNCGSGGCGQVASSSGGGGGGGGGGGCSSGCSGGQRFTKQTFSCGGSGCGGCSGSGCVQPPLSVSGQYWWEGDNSPFNVPPGHHVTNVDSQCGGSGCTASITTCGGAGCPPAQPQNPQPQRPQPQRPQPQRPQPQNPTFNPVPPATQPQPFRPNRPANDNNLVMPPMGICPATFVCVHWQLCRDGFVITDGTGAINKQIKEIPAQVSSRYRSCGANMVCCGVPSYNPPPVQNPPSAPFPLPLPAGPAPQAPPSVQLPPAPIPTKRPLPRPTARPSARPPASRPSSGGYASPTVPQNPLLPPQNPSRPQRPTGNANQNGFNSQPTIVNQAGPVPPAQGGNARPNPQPARPRPQPNVPISNPIGLVSPPGPQPMGMMGGMMGGMMMPMRGGTCSAGTYCVAPNQCNPYTGFIITDPTQLMAVWPDAPTVPLLPCFVPGAGQIQDGVCCQQAHPQAGGLD
ncbi:WAS/WASL-interacting protein family member 1-like isoform X2 [Penaeus japonicus]|uniref:WAS/WASL-interacting protein family member 1-like isoform X1 n=1 Tax=Penaeus japonicus TaxID=27405 RepID=UPI001C713BBA|nr:WAS/WASL-interacting protein family member 1-like isoform X1 [Penaeus japonicus]XP_042874496.1 WAS/WASL-interacting protein family member 1-like isoform X2 [Penaeus japonicus]